MKKTLTLAALLLAMAGTALAQEAKNIKVITYQSGKTFSQLLGDDRYEIDSIIVNYGTASIGTNEFSLLRDCCEKGRLTGIDLSGCRNIEDNRIPEMAFYPTYVNAKPSTGSVLRAESEEGENPMRTNLRYITLPKSIEEIGDYAFALTNLEAVTIPYWVKAICNGAFSDCMYLRDVTFYGNRTHAGDGGVNFSGLPAAAVLHVAPGLGDSYRSSGDWAAFSRVQEDDGLYNVQSVTLDGSRPLSEVMAESGMQADSMSVSGAATEDDIALLKESLQCGRLVSLDLSGCKIEDGNLYGCRMESLRMPEHMERIPLSFLAGSKVNALTMPDSYERIGVGAFSRFCWFADSTLVIPEGCRKIDYRAFLDCRSIRTLMLPSTLEVLEPASLAFNWSQEWIPSYVDIYVNRMTPPESSTMCEEVGMETDEVGPFDCQYEAGSKDCKSVNWRLFVPIGAKQNYESAKHWNHFMTIIETPLLTGDPTGIAAVTAASPSQAADGIYTIDGRIVSRSASADSLPRGLYIVRENGAARKVVTGK